MSLCLAAADQFRLIRSMLDTQKCCSSMSNHQRGFMSSSSQSSSKRLKKSASTFLSLCSGGMCCNLSPISARSCAIDTLSYPVPAVNYDMNRLTVLHAAERGHC